MQKVEADPLIVADAPAHLVDIRAVGFTQIGHLVDEADLGGQQAVSHILGHLRTFRRHHQERPVGPQEWRIKRVQPVRDLGPPDADNNPVRLVEIFDRRPFLQELRVAGHIDGKLRHLGHPPGELGIGADGNRAFDHDDFGRAQ